MSVFIQDLSTLPQKFSTLYKELAAGYFAVNTKGNAFSKIALDQAQEHNNKKIKSTSGYIDVVNFEDKDSLRKLELCFPEIDQYLNEVEGSSASNHHHRETEEPFLERFEKDFRKVSSKVITNPFSHP